MQDFPNTQASEFEEKPFDLRAFLFKYILSYWWLYGIGLMLGMTGAWLYLRYSTPQYLTKSTILIKDPATSGEVGSEDLLLQELGLSSASKNIQNEVQILKSRTLMLEVVRRLGLDVAYINKGRVRNSEAYKSSPVVLEKIDSLSEAPFLGSILLEPLDDNRFRIVEGDSSQIYAYNLPVARYGNVFVIRKTDFPFKGPVQVSFPDLEGIAQGYANSIDIKPVAEWSSVLELSLKDRVPEKAADILNTLIEVYNAAAIEDKNKISANTLDFIGERLALLTGELEVVEKDVEDYKRENEIVSQNAGDGTRLVDEINAYEREKSDIEIRRSIIGYVKEYLRNSKGSFELLPANLSLPNAALNVQIEKYNALLLERERLQRSAGDQHPDLNRQTAIILSTRENILSSVEQLEQETETSIKNLASRSGQFRGQVRSLPRKERELLEITRQQRIKENLYLYLLEKREETALSLAVTTPNSRLIDAAKSNYSPVEPKSQLIYTLAFVLGLGLPAGFILLRDLLNDTLQNEDDLKALSSAPVFGTIGFSKSKEHLVVKPNSRSAVSEMFRLLRTNLEFGRTREGCQAYLITSGVSGEGKSFITLNLGMSMALSNKKTVVIGLDMRKPKLGRYLGREGFAGKGLSQYLIGEATEAEIIQESGVHPSLWHISSGPIPPNPAELIQSDRMPRLFEYLRANFDYLIIDSPPLGLVSDALMLSPMADRTLFVVRQGQTKKALLRRLEELHQEGKVHHAALIFNGIKAGRG
ncbi:MAG: polysaccharide biosynthesis tyrosine autokinase, partial [Saprospiraceae bacterium]|nr:polysaccharide biosynthesis tyrosine autokinase [Saprospiraceae bacterium]